MTALPPLASAAGGVPLRGDVRLDRLADLAVFPIAPWTAVLVEVGPAGADWLGGTIEIVRSVSGADYYALPTPLVLSAPGVYGPIPTEAVPLLAARVATAGTSGAPTVAIRIAGAVSDRPIP